MTEALRQAHIALTAIFTHPTLELSDFMRDKLTAAIAAAEAELSQPAREALTDAQIEAIAVEHEDFGFGRVGARGVSTHGFSPEGLVAFARAIEAAHGIGTAGAQEATR